MQYATLGRTQRAAALYLAFDWRRQLQKTHDEACSNAMAVIGPPGKRVAAKMRQKWTKRAEELLVAPLREILDQRILERLAAERGLPVAGTVAQYHDALEAYVHARPRGLVVHVMVSVLQAHCPSNDPTPFLSAVLEKWTCSLNVQDPLRSSCAVPEQVGDDESDVGDGVGDDDGGDRGCDDAGSDDVGSNDDGSDGGTGTVRRSQRLERARKRRRLEGGSDASDSSSDDEDGDSDDAGHGDGASSAATDATGLDELNVAAFLDDPHRGGEPGIFLSMAHIAEAADNLDDPIIKSFAAAAYDKHCQAVTTYVICNTALWQEL